MPNYTKILGLEQPFQEDDYNIEVFNNNTKKVDDYMISLASPAEVEIEGRMLINLLGRAGNFIYKQDWTAMAGCVATYDSDKYVISNTIGYMSKSIDDILNKYYILLMDTDNGDGYRELSPTNKKGVYSKGRYYAYKCEDNSTKSVRIYSRNGSSYFKNIRLYEITQAEYDALSTMTADQVAEKYPYVDDVKPVINPYIESRENLFTGNNDTLFNGAIDGASGVYYSATTNPEYKHIAILVGKDDFSTLQQYTINSDIAIPTGIKLTIQCRDKNNVYISSTAFTSTMPFTFTPNAGTSKINLMFSKDDGTDITSLLFTLQKLIKSITISKGTTPKIYNKYHNSRIMFETKLYSGEKITRRNDGQYVKNSEWEELRLLAELNPIWYPAYNFTDYSCIQIDIKTLIGINIALIIDYLGAFVKADVSVPRYSYWIDNARGFLYLILPNTLTGWGDSYTPTADEIKAFFLGWRMYNSGNNDGGYTSIYNGTGYKWFCKLYCGIGNKSDQIGVYVVGGSHTNILPTTLNDQGYTPYRLIYKKATPTIEEIKIHGALDVSPDDVLTTGSGLVLGELVFPYDRGNGLIYIGDSVVKQSFPKYRTGVYLRALADGESVFMANILGSTENIISGRGENALQVSKVGKENLVDYLMYKPDTVQSFDYTITTDDDLKTVVEKLVEENSAVNGQLAKVERELVRAKVELSQRSNPNLLLNPEFNIAQRGTSFNVGVANIYTVDRWLTTNSPAGKVERVANTAPIKTPYNLRVMANSVNSYNIVCQPVEYFDYMVGDTYTLSFWARSVKGDLNFNAYIGDNIFFLKATTAWKFYKITAKVSTLSSATSLQAYARGVRFCFTGVTTDTTLGYELAQAKLELGEYATPFVPRGYGEELVMCQRYYESYFVSSEFYQRIPNFSASSAAPTNLGMNVQFKVVKRAIPTVIMRYDINDGTDTPFTPTSVTTYGFKTSGIIIPAYGFMDINSWTAESEIY